MTDEHTTSHVVELTADECWELAASRPVGRLAWQSHDGPTVVPVNFVVDGHRVRIRTAAYSAMARECDDSPVAFEVDDVDEQARAGWSVLFRGRAHAQFHGWEDGVEPDAWPDGSRGLRVEIDVREVSGRRLEPHQGVS
jgi:nitroimidazol reductase NimA-like FMN-containing flavoprotein (pyridoxamine 5'-phosphate oxidase superfamily)